MMDFYPTGIDGIYYWFFQNTPIERFPVIPIFLLMYFIVAAIVLFCLVGAALKVKKWYDDFLA